MIEPKDLVDAFANNLSIIRQQCDGLTHADSLRQLPFRGNCLNWVLGHIAENRDGILKLLGQPPALGEAKTARYGYGSEPVTGEGAGVLTLGELLAALEQAQAGIASGLARVTPGELAREIDLGWRKGPLGQCLFFLYWHETYHTGQAEPLRQLAGKNDHVI